MEKGTASANWTTIASSAFIANTTRSPQTTGPKPKPEYFNDFNSTWYRLTAQVKQLDRVISLMTSANYFFLCPTSPFV